MRDLEPLIREHANDSEVNCKLSTPVVEAIRDAGLFKIFTPRALGGLEFGLPEAYKIFEAFAHIDSAVGWAVANSNAPAFTGAALPLYNCGAISATPFITTVALSSANNALKEALILAEKKTPAYMPAAIGDRPVAQAQLAEAKGKIEASRVYLAHALENLWANAAAGQAPNDEQKYTVQIASSHGTKAAGEAINLIFQVVTSSGTHRRMPFERYMRDIQTLMTHAFTSTARFESAGKMMMGRFTDWAFLY